MAANAGPIPPNLNRAGKIMASVWTPFPFTVLLLTARLYVRIRRHRIGVDDLFMVTGWLFYFTNQILLTLIADLGGFRHIEYISPSNLARITQLTLAAEAIGLIAAFFAKSSVALLLPRVLNRINHTLSYFLYANIVIYGAISIASIITIFVQCHPLKALWEPQLIKEGLGDCNGHNANVDVAYVQGSYGVYMDFLLAFLPVPIIYRLKLTGKTRFGICALLGLGVFAGTCAIIKTIQFDTENSDDPTWSLYALILWATLEVPLTIIAGCVPPSKPLYDSIFKGQPLVDEQFKQRQLNKAPSIISLANLSSAFQIMRGRRLNGSSGARSARSARSVRSARRTHSGNDETTISENVHNQNSNPNTSTNEPTTVQKIVTVEESSAPASVGSTEHEATRWYRDPPANRI